MGREIVGGYSLKKKDEKDKKVISSLCSLCSILSLHKHLQ